MKSTTVIRMVILNMLTVCLLVSGCSKEENIFDEAYDGLLNVEYVNTLPDWVTSEEMEISISQTGQVVIQTGSLSYSGEYILGDSKITRSGSWQLAPAGHVTTEGGMTYIVVDPGITVVNDITRIYAKDNYGNWVQVSEAPYSGASGGDVTFSFEQATLAPGGAVTGVNVGTGSITWTLELFPGTVPIVP